MDHPEKNNLRMFFLRDGRKQPKANEFSDVLAGSRGLHIIQRLA